MCLGGGIQPRAEVNRGLADIFVAGLGKDDGGVGGALRIFLHDRPKLRSDMGLQGLAHINMLTSDFVTHSVSFSLHFAREPGAESPRNSGSNATEKQAHLVDLAQFSQENCLKDQERMQACHTSI